MKRGRSDRPVPPARRDGRCPFFGWAVALMVLASDPLLAAQATSGDPSGATPGFETEADMRDRLCPEDTARRLAYLEARIHDNASYARGWWRTWTGVFVAGMAFEGVRAGLADEREDRAASVASAAKSTIGLARALTSRPKAMEGLDGLDTPIRHPEACRERLADAEERLQTSAEEAREERFGWASHLGNLALNAGAAVAVAELYDYDEAYWSGALGFAIGEVRIWSYPWHAEDDWEEYEMRFGDRPRDESDTTWFLQPAANGARVVLRF